MEALSAFLREKHGFMENKMKAGQRPDAAQLRAFLTSVCASCRPLVQAEGVDDQVASDLRSGFASVGWDVTTNGPDQSVTNPPSPEKVLGFLDKAAAKFAPRAGDAACARLATNVLQIIQTSANDADVGLERIAVEGDNCELTYGQLMATVASVAHAITELRLPKRTGSNDQPWVGLFVPRSVDLVPALLGILGSGAGFVPMDTDFPLERLEAIAKDAEVAAFVTHSSLLSSQLLTGAKVVCIDHLVASESALDKPNGFAGRLPAHDVCYVTYTSGSTGRQKGVVVEHKSVANVMTTMARRVGIGRNDSMLAVSTISFDISVLELLLPLCVGARVRVCPRDIAANPERLIALIDTSRATMMQATPTTWSMLVQTGWRPSTGFQVLCGGESMPVWLAQKLTEKAETKVWNLYGPTEATIWCSAELVDVSRCEEENGVPIGAAFEQTQLHVLDDHMRPVSSGESGELYISGVGVAREYWNLPELSEKSFVQFKGQRAFRTGDIVRRCADGQSIVFVGRKDDQVKVNGYRIELGDIEAALLHSSTCVGNAAATTTRDAKTGFGTLVAFVVPATGFTIEEISPENLRTALQRTLPSYMVPSRIVAKQDLPLLPNGKLNRRLLVEELKSLKAHLKRPDPASTTTPQTRLQILCGIWRDVLDCTNIHDKDNVFDLGADSVSCFRAVLLGREAMVPFSLTQVLESSSIRQLEMISRGLSTGSLENTQSGGDAPQAQHNNSDPFPLTEIQHAYWVGRDSSYQLGNISTHEYYEFSLSPQKLHSVDRLEQALRKVITRHEMLRAVVLPDGQQVVLQDVAPFKITRVTVDDNMQLKDRQLAVREQMSHQVFDTASWPLFGVTVILCESKTGELNSGSVHFGIDLIIADARSLMIMFDDWREFYDNVDTQMPKLEASFRNFALEHGLSSSSKRLSSYWTDRLASFPARPELPLRHDSLQSLPKFNRRRWELDKEDWLGVKEIAQARRISPACVLCCAYAGVLAHFSESSEFALNVLTFMRHRAETSKVVGDFTSMTLLHCNMDAFKPFVDEVHGTQKQLWADLDHQQDSGMRVLRELQKARGTGDEALFPVIFTSMLGEFDLSSMEWIGKCEFSISQTSQAWLDNQVYENGGNLVVCWDAVEQLFPEGLLDNMFEQYCLEVRKLTLAESWDLSWAQRHRKADQIPVQVENSSSKLLHSSFLRFAQKTPNAVAILSQGKSLKYREVLSRAKVLAHKLRHYDCGRNQLVAVVMSKGWEQVVAALGILMTGAAYLPIEASLPKDRVSQLLELGQVAAVVAQPDALVNHFSLSSKYPVILVQDDIVSDADAETTPPTDFETASASDTAYVIFTSGSTGTPKGVVIDHRGALNTVDDINERFGVQSEDRILALSELSFDLSVYDIFGLLSVGGAIVIPRKGSSRDPGYLLEELSKNRVTLWNSVPALMEMIIEFAGARLGPAHVPQTLRLVLMSGDWIPLSLPDRIKMQLPTAKVISLGGATEASIWSIIYEIEEVDPSWTSIPYGKALTRQTTCVLSDQLQPRPVWSVGEIHIGGVGVARGYLLNESLTRERFITLTTGERVYKTGDLGRLLPDGNIEILGRLDFQVKVGGYRIELGEIEAAVSTHPAVQKVVITAPVSSEKRRRLVGYVICVDGTALDSKSLETFLKDRLPVYMVPSQFLFVDHIPLTPNGKIDSKALELLLTAPAVSAAGQTVRDEALNAPTSPNGWIEDLVLQLCKQMLGKDVSVEDDLLEAGLDSVMAIKLAASAGQKGAKFTLRQVLQQRSVRKICSFVSGSVTEEFRIHETVDIPDISSSYSGRADPTAPFDLTDIQQAYLIGRSDAFDLGSVAAHTYKEFSNTMFDVDKLQLSLNRMISRHAALRLVFDSTSLTQKVLPPHETIYQIPVITLGANDAEAKEATVLEIRAEMSHQVLSPDKWPLFDIRVLKMGQKEARMFLSIDLLILDARSVNFFFQEWRQLYESLTDDAQGTTPTNPSDTFDFDDYVVSVGSLHHDGRFSKSHEYWSRRISSLPPGPVLPESPLGSTAAKPESPRFVRHTAILSADVWTGLQSACRTRGVTASSAICASFLLVLAAWSASESFCINVTIFNRLEVHKAVKKIFGDFTSTVLLEKPNHNSSSFVQFCAAVQEQMWEDLQHRHMSGIEVLRNLGMAKGQGGVMIPVVFTSALEFDSDAMKWLGTYDYGVSQTPQVNLDCQVFRRGQTVVINFDVLAAAFPDGLIDQMQESLIVHLQSLTGSGSNWDQNLAQCSAFDVDRSMYVYSRNDQSAANPRTHLRAQPSHTAAGARSREDLASQLRAMWTELLPNCEAESIVDSSNWFSLGGDSVSIIKGASHLSSRGISVSLSDLFYNPVFGNLVDAILSKTTALGSSDVSDIVHVEAERYNRFALTAIQQAYVVGRSGALSRSQHGCHDYTEFDGMSLDLDRLSKALQVVVSRHDSLRTILHEGDMSQEVLATVPLYQIQQEDLSSLAPTEQESRLQHTRARMSHQTIDISSWPSWEICASKVSGETYRLHVSIDLTFIDIQSMGMFFEEWKQAYEHSELPHLPDFTFRDYIITENELRLAGAFSSSREYWLQRLDSLPPAPKLPLKQAGSVGLMNPAFHRIKSKIESKTWTLLETQAKQLEVTPSVVLLSSFARIVGLWSADPNFSINCTIFDRMLPAANDLLGDFTSTVILQVLDSDQPIKNLLKQVQRQLVDDLDHRFMSGVEVAQEMRRNAENGTSMLPIVFTSALDFDSDCMQWLGCEGFGVSQTPNVFLDCQIYRSNGDACVVWDYDTHMLDGDIVSAMFTAFDQTLRHFSCITTGWLDIQAPPRPIQQHQTKLREATHAMVPKSTRSVASTNNSLEPRLLEAFATVLQIPHLKPTDDFFHNGGDSVSALRIITLCREFASVTIDMVFTERTVANLTKQLHQVSDSHATESDVSTYLPDTENVHVPFPLNEIQHAYWMGRLSAFEMGNNASHSYSEFEVASIDTVRLNRALNVVVRRHPMLRAVLNADGFQRILPATDITKYEIKEGFTDDAEEQNEVVVATREQMTAQQFSLEEWPLWELRITHLGSSGLARLHFGIDLIIADARSIVLIFTELGKEYHALADPAYSAPPMEPTFTFRDYVHAASTFRDSHTYIESENYWLGRLSSLPSAPPLPTQKSPEELQKPEFGRRRMTLTTKQWHAFKRGAQAISATPSAALCAAFAEVLALWSACHHFVINTTVFNRLPFHPDVDGIVGDFTSTILLEIDYREAIGSFQNKALAVQKQLSRDLQSVFFNGVLVQRALAKKRKSQKASQFPVVFTSTIFDDSTSFESLGRYVCGISQTPQVQFDCQVYETADGLVVHWDTVDELFPSGMIADMFTAFEALVLALCEAAEESQPWGHHACMVPQPQQRERESSTATLPVEQLPVKMPVTLSEQETPCIIHNGGKTLSGAQLLAASDAIMQQCSSSTMSIERGTCIPVIMHKGWEQVVAVFAVLTMGCAYVPIDASMPTARVRAMLMQLPNFPRMIVITQAALRDSCKDVVGSDASIIVVDERASYNGVEAQAIVSRMTARACQIQPKDLAYIIFTSGTTGTPKGVEIEHISVTNLVTHFVESYAVDAHDKIIALSSLWFDLSVFDVFAALTTGATLVIPDHKKLTDPAYLSELLISTRVTIWNSVPTTMEMLIVYLEANSHVCIDSLRLVILSGDRIATSLPGRLAKVLPNTRLIAAGGPTEDTVWAIKYETPLQLSPGGKTVPYGKTIPNMQAYVLSHDSNGNVVDDCPTWTTGGIYFSGVGVARGYLGDESSPRFVMHPRKKVRLHRTGDIGRFLPGGDIEILGREDFQVKMNGFRIEVEEIEAAMLDHNRVSQCAVVVQQTAGSKRLVAFWTSASKPADNVSSVKRLNSTEAAIFKIDQHNIRKLNERTAIRLERQDEETAIALSNARKSCRSFSSDAIPLAQLRVIVESACSCLTNGAHDTSHLLSVYMWTKIPMPTSSRDANATTRRFEIVATNDGKLQLVPMSNSADEAQLPVSVATILGGKENEFATKATAIVSIFANHTTTSPRKALITAGRIGHALMMAALDTDASIGVCPIGGLDSRALQSALGLAPNGQAKLLHALVIGPMAAGNVPASAVPESASEEDAEPKVELSKPIASIDLASHVSARLPRYMVPTAFHHMDALPLNLNGKIDRAKLMETVVDTSYAAQNSSDSQLTGAPTSTKSLSATEQQIAEIWMKVLQLPEVGRSQHFDALTESRNLFTRVILRRMVCDLMNRAGLIIEQATLFECNTIAELATAVDGTGVVRGGQAVQPVGPASAASDASTTTFTPDQLAIENQLLTIFRDALSLRNEASLSPKDDFFLSGGDSLLAVAVTLQIRKKLKIDIPFTAIFNNRTASSMATLLRKNRLADASIVVIQQGTRAGAVPLFLVHPALRTTLTYNRVVEKLDKEQTVYGLEDHRPPAQRCAYTSLEQMAAHYVNAISLLMPKDRPVLLGGWSFGAVLGMEIAQQLQASGFAVPLLLMLEVAPTSAIGWFPSQHPRKFEQLETHAQIKHLMAVSMAVWYAFPTRSITGPCTVDAAALAKAESNDHRFRYMYQHLLEGVMPLEEGLVYLAQFVDDYVESEQLLLGYSPKEYAGEVVLFSGSDDTKSSADVHLDNFSDSDRPALAGNAPAAAASEDRGWAQFTQRERLEVLLTPGNHDNLLLPPHVDTTSKLLAEVLDRHGFNAALQ